MNVFLTQRNLQMDRRKFIKQTAAASSLTLLPNVSWAFDRSSERSNTNILFIMTDQQTISAMSHRDNPYLETPNMDRLADHGTSFSQAYCSQPLCGPSRSSMLTGKYPHQVQATVNLPEKEGYWDDDVPMLGRIMQEAGYETGYVGKWHLPIPVENIDQHGFSFIRNTQRRDWQDASIPADCGVFLKKKRDKPFFLVASFINPHDICEWARGGRLRMDNIADAPAPQECPPLPDNLEIPENEPAFLRTMKSLSPKQYPSTNWPDDKWRQYRWAYYRLVETVDAYIGRIMESLERTGQLENTTIVFTSDHGDGMGAHRWNQKQVLYQEVINVPFIISHLKNGKKRLDSTTLVNVGVDLIPTFCDYAGFTAPKELEGVGLKSIAEGEQKKARDYIVCETEFAENEDSFGVLGRSVYDGRYKYIAYRGKHKTEQLFDLKQDVGEMKDLSSNIDYNYIKKALQQSLIEWQMKTKDSRFVL